MTVFKMGRAQVEVERLPAFTKENEKEINDRQISKYKHKENVCPMLWQGFLEMEIRAGDTVRTAKLYVPEDNPQGTSFIIMNVPEGRNAIDFIFDSGWKAIADKEKMPLFLMEPADGVSWGTPQEEQEYMIACLNAHREGVWLNPGFCKYVIGYGKIAENLHKYVMENPLNVGGGAFVDASDLPLEYLNKTGDAYVDTPFWQYGFTMKEVPTPVLLLNREENENVKNVLRYWKRAAEDKNAVNRYSEAGPDLLNTIVETRTGAFDYGNLSTTELIWNHIGRYYRYGMGFLSNHIYHRVKYEELGVEFRSFTDSLGIDRNFLVYVPEKYRGTDEKLPVVISFHGWSNTMRQQFENTLWHELADREGFIVVCPETLLFPNPASGLVTAAGAANPKWAYMMDGNLVHYDTTYFKDLLKFLKEEYPIDSGRIYGNGQSMGCGQSLFLCQTDAGDNFAAIASCSGLPLLQEHDTRDKYRDSYRTHVPTFVMMGEYDLWDYRIDNEEDSPLTKAADIVLKRLGLATDETVNDVRLNKADAIYTDGRFHNFIWKNQQGIPMFRYTWIEKQCHAITPMESRAAWYEWMSQFRLDTETGKRYYRGVEITD